MLASWFEDVGKGLAKIFGQLDGEIVDTNEGVGLFIARKNNLFIFTRAFAYVLLLKFDRGIMFWGVPYRIKPKEFLYVLRHGGKVAVREIYDFIQRNAFRPPPSPVVSVAGFYDFYFRRPKLLYHKLAVFPLVGTLIWE